MRKQALLRLVSVTVLTLGVASIFAQETDAAPARQSLDFTEVIKGEKIPALIKAEDLAEDFKAVEIKVGSGTSYFESIMPFMGMAGGSGRDQRMFTLMSLMEVSWTKGEVVDIKPGKASLASGAYLITYKLDMGMFDLVRMGEQGSPTQTMMKLVLVKTDQIVSISPRPRIDKKVLLSVDQATTEFESDMNSGQLAAQKTASLSNLKQLALGMMLYAGDCDDVLPYVQSTASARAVVYPYVKNKDVFRSRNPAGGIFQFNMAIAGVTMTDIPAPAETVLFYESGTWPDGTRGAAFVDGHAKMLSAAEWQSASASLNLKLKRKAKPLPVDYLLKHDPLLGQETDAGST